MKISSLLIFPYNKGKCSVSNYKTHSIFSSLITLPFCLFVIYKYLNLNLKETLLFSSTFLYATLFMSPDVDVASKIKLKSVRGFFTLPFRSYSKIFRHRGISHSLVFGFVTRVVWLALWAVAILYLIKKPFSTDKVFRFGLSYKSELMWIFSGIIISDASHIFLDKISKKRP